LGHDKTYVGIIRVHKESSIEALQKVINEKFIGKISQIPPKKSSVRRAVREREIKKFEILEKSEKDFLFLSKVQGGTYIRKLCSDLGESVGGAHMLELRRIKAGVFDEKQSVTLYDFERAVEEYENGKDKLLREMIIPAEEMIRKNFEFVELDKNILERALTGKPLFREDLEEFPKNEIFAVFSGERFVEIARKCDEGAIFARPEFVLN
jgi:tRNA U55 pseudouridine synthase TruB